MKIKKPLETKTPGDFCKAVREREELSQRDWAKKLKFSQPYVNQVEKGMYVDPREYFKKLRPFISKREVLHLTDIHFRIFLKDLGV